MKLSRWQTVKHTPTGRAYITIRGSRFYMSDFASRTVYHKGERFHGVSWCGYYYIQIDHYCEEVRWTYVA